MLAATDLVLLQFRMADPHAAARLGAQWRAFCAAAEPSLHARRAAWSAATATAYIYLEPAQAMGGMDLALLAQDFARRFAGASEVRASRLEQVFDAVGASAGERAVFHYAVETDPEEGWMAEIARWYDTEHMPGLAAVPGCIRATRFINHGHGPLSLACYDLVREETLGSPPWLAVRATAWSDIARPHFTNTRRTMFSVLP